ncbi:MAG TPA: helix-turn-helix domain-containing protein [Hymenobacter sp.]|jgi:AraC family transcriptional activator of pobA|uniref:helix-turn-helix domain-containing protein n=1 Tax=Hymenobacter sp. TaxID=1898978 RepID=UPI002ED8B24C
MPAILNFNGLYGDNGPAVLPDFVHCEPLETRSQQYNWVIPAHVHAYLFQVFCIEEGEGRLLVEQREHTFSGPCLLVIPDSTLHGFAFAATIRGTVLTLSAAYVEALFGPASPVRSGLDSLHILPGANAPALFAESLHIVAKIRAELFGNMPARETMVPALFTLLFTTIFRLAHQQNEHGLVQNNRSLALFQAFLKRVKEARRPQKTIAAYAAELRITPVHLNRVCQAVAQKTAVRVVQSYFVAEAQKYLVHTSFTISEVAYALNFEDPAYFSRLFRQHSGLSPKQFRQGRAVTQQELAR